MLNHDLRIDDGILVLNPQGPLEAADFTALAGVVDAYLRRHGTLRGVLIHAESFPGWKDFGALITHLKFVKDHHQAISKVAIVADGTFATVMPRLARHFIRAQVQHFDYAEMDVALDWLKSNGNARAAA